MIRPSAPTQLRRRPWAVPEGRAPFEEVDIGPNRVALLKDGFQAFPAMLAAIESAQSTICLETYILRDDTTGQRFAKALMERARAGVEVLLIYDAWGSKVSASFVAELREAGVKVLPFRPLKWVGSLGRVMVRLFRRDHRKTLVVDGIVGFTGGLNVSDEYAAISDGGQGWRDTHVRIIGPAAIPMERLFLSTWAQHRGPRFNTAKFIRPTSGVCKEIRIVGNDFAIHRKDIRKAYIDAFQKAERRIFITNAYFLPPLKVLKVLYKAVRRGVRVGLILGASTDVKAVLYAARGLYPKLLRNGIEVYEWTGPVLHAKTAVADRMWVTIGSANLDALSLRQNLEVNAVFLNAELGAASEQLFFEDLARCERITEETIRSYGPLQRALSWVAYQFRHYL